MASAGEDDKTIIVPRGPSGLSSTLEPKVSIASDENSGNPLKAGSCIAEFEIESVLGEGGFGIVYLAWDHSLERRVALKEYMPAALSVRDASSNIGLRSERHRETFDAGMRSFINEAKLLAQFDHPSLVKVYRFWESHGTAYMVMPYYEGPTLKQVLASAPRPLSEEWLKSLLIPLTEALEVLHRQQIYHRDVAPDNILILNGSGRPVILDFGAARRVIGDMTQALTVILKTGYAPVEQYAEVPDMRQGPWTDIYALAAVSHYALKGVTPPASVGRMINDSYKPLRTVLAGQYSDGLLSAIDQALSVKPENRFQDMESFRKQLTSSLGSVKDVDANLQVSALTVDDDLPIPKIESIEVPKSRLKTHSIKKTDKKPNSLAVMVGGVLAFFSLIGVGLYWALSDEQTLVSETGQTNPEFNSATPVTNSELINPTQASPVAAIEPAQEIGSNKVFDVLTEFDKVVSGSHRGFQVNAKAQQNKLKIDRDLLRFTIDSSFSGYVYVFLRTTDGKLMQLLPNSQTPEIRIKAAQSLDLPPENGDLVAGGPPGIDHFLVIVSESKRQFKALDIKINSGFGFINPSSETLLANWSARQTPILLGDTFCSSQPCSDAYGAAVFSLEEIY